MRQFEGMLGKAIALSNQIVTCQTLHSGEIITEFTDRAEAQTQHLTGISIDRSLTAREMGLECRECGEEACPVPALVRQVRRLNREGIALVERLIDFKQRLMNGAGECTVFTANYPLLIEHILREARLYRDWLMHLEGNSGCDCGELRRNELFWNQIMMEHALFIRGLLDPSQTELIETADGFAEDYRRLLEASGAANERAMKASGALALTEKFRDFKRAGVEGIENCTIRSIILPLLADHVLQEANHYIRLLKE